MKKWLRSLRGFFNETLWTRDPARMPAWRARLLRAIRVVYAVVMDVLESPMRLYAMGLVYTTLLSIVPLLALGFSLLQAFGFHNRMEPALRELLQPLGEKADTITEQIVGSVDNLDVGVLGGLGLILLLYTVIGLMQKIEGAFNHTWHVAHERPIAQRVAGYLSIVLIGPLLVFSALGITATLTDASFIRSVVAVEPFRTLTAIAGRLLPYLLVIGAFALLYMLIPNARVRFGAAAVGAAVGGGLWQTLGWLFAASVAGSARYTAIYSGFAALVLFMIWLYLSWLVLLLGSSVAYYVQHPEATTQRGRPFGLSARLRERLALAVVARVGRRFYAGEPRPSIQDLSRELDVPADALPPVMRALEEAGVLCRNAERPSRYLPACPFDATPLEVAVQAVRRDGERRSGDELMETTEPEVFRLAERLERAVTGELAGWTLKDLVTAQEPAGELDDAPRPAPRVAVRAADRGAG